jgi:hypothetical protein
MSMPAVFLVSRNETDKLVRHSKIVAFALLVRAHRKWVDGHAKGTSRLRELPACDDERSVSAASDSERNLIGAEARNESYIVCPRQPATRKCAPGSTWPRMKNGAVAVTSSVAATRRSNNPIAFPGTECTEG